jgi:ribosomal-protein-alanine N-acetyltransferase
VSELQQLRADHAPELLRFERENREYFARSISDRGDEFFDHFDERLQTLLDDQEAGGGAYYVAVAEDGSVLGRFNLIFRGDGEAELGYRVAERAAGRGLATECVEQLCILAAVRHGVRTIEAATSDGNVASQRVLAKTGFVEAGRADPAHIGGKQGSRHRRDLVGSRA